MNNSSNNDKQCALCERFVNNISRHHLVPKETGGRYGETVPLCQPCHSTIHFTFTNKDLAKEFNTIPKLQKAEALQNYLKWIRRRRVEKISNRRSS